MYSYCTWCTVHGELTCGSGGNICIHVYLQLPYTVQHTRCTIHSVLTCGGGGNIRIHVYLQLPYTVYHTRWTHVWWWGQYTHTCVPTATVHGAPYMMHRTRCTVHGVPYTVYRTRWTNVWRGHSHVGATHVCRGHSRVGVTHVWDEPPKWNSSLLDILGSISISNQKRITLFVPI